MSAITVQQEVNWDVMEKVVVGGDLSKLSAPERVMYYRQLCESLRLNPLTQPFQYIRLQGPNGKLSLYATKDATEQIRRMHNISIERVEKEVINDTYCVTVYGKTPDGRTDTEMGVVSIAGKRGDDLVNAMMKALTKAKRRLTLSMCGLGVLDETEIETIRGARTISPEELGAEVDQDGMVIASPATVRALPQPEPADPEPQPQMESQRKRMWATAREKGWTDEQVHNLLSVEFPKAVDAETKKPSTKALDRGEMNLLIQMVSYPPPFAEPIEGEVVGEQQALATERGR